MVEHESIDHVAESQVKPEFDAGFFTISYFSTDPEGFRVQTRQSLPRRDLLPGKSYPGELALSPDQRAELRKGMANEAFFTLPRDFPADKKNDLKTMFTLIDEVATQKDHDEIDSTYHEKLYQLQTLRRELRPLLHQYNLTEQLGVKVGVRNIEQTDNTLTLDVRPVSYPMYAVAASPEDIAETLDLGAVTGTAAILVTADNKIIL